VTLSPKVLRKTTLNLNVLLSSLFSVVDAMKENPMSLIRVAHTLSVRMIRATSDDVNTDHCGESIAHQCFCGRRQHKRVSST